MERLRNQKNTGLNGNALRTWGLLFLATGTIGRGIIQKQLLGVGEITAQQMLDAMSNSQGTMILVTLSLVLQALETCAAPIFALLLVEGFQHTSDFMRYLTRVLGLAVLCEIPYNLAVGSGFLDWTSRNPVFCMVLGLIQLYFYQRYAEKSLQNTLIKAVVTIAAVIWGEMLKIEFGSCMVLVIAVLWAFRKKPLYRNFAGATVTIVCSLMSPFFLAAPMGFLAVHFYNGERGEENRLVNYLAYPAMLLIAGLLGIFLF